MSSVRVAVVIPCFRVEKNIVGLLNSIGPEVSDIYCVDDHCPNGSGRVIRQSISDPRVKVIFHDSNVGVGGAVVTGYKAALADGAEVIVKLDGDGQMDAAQISSFTGPIIAGHAEYTKGNRFFRIEDLKGMPWIRMLGNAILSFFCKLSSGYWNLFDPTNGYTAIHANLVRNLPLDKISKGFFFESDILFRLNTVRAMVMDIPLVARYGPENTNLQISKIVLPFLRNHLRNLFKRIFYNYFLRDFNIASCELLLGLPLLIFGLVFGGYHWHESAVLGTPATSGTVMLSGLPVLVGIQLVLSFLNFDIGNVPKYPIHALIGPSRATPLPRK